MDQINQTASVTAIPDGFFELGDGSSPSTTFVPALQGWQTNLFTGAAGYAMPIDLPAGPGGLKPQLQLAYNSAQTDGDYHLFTHKQAGWAGKGWDLTTGYIALNKMSGDDYFSLVLNGKSSPIARGKRLSGANYSSNWLQGWEWFATDENFTKIRAVYKGDYAGPPAGKAPRNVWVVWTRDGTRYEFSQEVTWLWNDETGACGTYETYKWMLSKITDPSGNTIVYNYTPVNVTTDCYSNIAVQPDIYLSSILWGYDGSTPGTGTPRYKVIFDSSWRSAGGNTVAPAEDMAWDFADTMRGSVVWDAGNTTKLGKLTAPHETRRLDAIRLLSWQPGAADYQLVHQYSFAYEPWASAGGAPLYSDGYICQIAPCSETTGTYGPDPAYRKLTLKSIQVLGSDQTLFPTNAAPIKTTFSYYNDPAVDRGARKDPKGGWSRLKSMANGQGGALTFAYASIGEVYRPQGSWYTIFFNRHRVTSETRTDGRNNSYTTIYQYGQAEMNSLGNAYGGKGPNVFPNSATLVYWDRNGQPPHTLAGGEQREFRGHAVVTETLATADQIIHYFIQGEGDPDANPDNGVGCNPAAASGDACFASLRDNEFQSGKEWKTVWRTAGGARLKETVHTFANIFYPGTLYQKAGPPVNDSWPEYTNNGLWRAFRYESQTDERIYEGGSPPRIKTTRFYYLTNPYQANQKQYGNLTRIEEYEGATLVRYTEHLFTQRDSESWTWPANNLATYTINYIVDRQWLEQTRDGVLNPSDNNNGRLLALTHYYYDSNTTAPAGIGTKGALTRVSAFYDVPLQSNAQNITLHGADTVYAYDTYGNRTSETTYVEAGTRLQASNTWTISAPGNGSATRRISYQYDSTFHAFPTRVTYPAVNGVTLVEQAGYDYRMGTLTSVTDPNNAVTTAEYDVFGRIVKLIKPGDTSTYPTTQFTYYDNEFPVRYRVDQRETAGNPATRVTQTFYDGIGRDIQTKSESSDGINPLVNTVVDRKYDGLGRAIEVSQPRYLVETSSSFFQYSAPGSPLFNPTTTSYDLLGRPLRVTTPDNQFTIHRYGVVQEPSGAVRAYHDVVDANRHRTEYRTDAFERLVQVQEFAGNCSTVTAIWPEYPCGGAYTESWNAASPALTNYVYSPRDLLTDVYDAANNHTQLGYDSLGRKTAMPTPIWAPGAISTMPTAT